MKNIQSYDEFINEVIYYGRSGGGYGRSTPRSRARTRPSSLHDGLRIAGEINKDVLDKASSVFYRNAEGLSRAKNGSFWHFQIKAVLFAWQRIKKDDPKKLFATANDIISENGHKLKKQMISEHLLPAIKGAIEDLRKMGITPENLNGSEAAEAVASEREKEEKERKQAQYRYEVSSLSGAMSNLRRKYGDKVNDILKRCIDELEQVEV